MKIVYVIEDFSIKGGAERIISEKANYLCSKYHHEINIISIYHDEKPMSYSLEKGVKFISLDIPFTTKSKWRLLTLLHRIFTMLKIIVKFQKNINQINPDIIFYSMSLGAILLPLCKTKAKKIYESHLGRSFTPYHQLFYPMEKAADKVICLTKEDASEYKHAKEVHVIPNFINIPSQKVENYGVKRAIAVGRLEYQKGFDILIKTWSLVIKEQPEWHLDIYGEGNCRKQLEHLISTLQLNDSITLCGRKDNLQDLYPRYSLHIMSSRYEGLAMTLIEAQSFGLPSVTFDFKYGVRDVIKNKYNGIIVPQNNMDLFAKAIIHMISSKNLREEYGIHALSIAKKFYRESIITKWINLIDDISNDKDK